MHIALLSRLVTGAAALLALSVWAGAAVSQDAPATQPSPSAVAEHDIEALSEFRPVVETLSESRNLSSAPQSVAELLELESRIRQTVEKALPATVSLIITRENNQFQGSGVIISPDGYVLTAAHVAERPGNRVTVIMHDGTRYRGITLGLNRELDDGLVKITDPEAGEVPWAPLGSADALPAGTWTVALGHPGGYQQGRPPVVRVGRVLAKAKEYLLTDNTLVGGDSGGPLFDLDGRVIGIHSRIEQGIVNNVHVPSDRFLEDWDGLIQSKQWGGMLPDWMRRGPAADDGLRFDFDHDEGEGARVRRVLSGSPAEQAGIEVHDRIIAIDDKPVTNAQELMLRRTALRPGKPVMYTVRRGNATMRIEVTPVEPTQIRVPNERSDPGRPVLGIEMDPAYQGPGVRLEAVSSGGPAERSGLTAGDIIIGFDGQMLRNGRDLGEAMSSSGRAGRTVILSVQRGGETLTIGVTLAAFNEVYSGTRGR